jgi:hypothetical protein
MWGEMENTLKSEEDAELVFDQVHLLSFQLYGEGQF